MVIGAIVCFAAAAGILLFHEFKVLQIKDYKAKYDYVNLNEIRNFWYAVVALILAAALYGNSLFSEKILRDGIQWFYARIFISACFVVVSYIIFYSLVRIYYPRYLEKKLDRLRNKPRISPHGNLMRKLNEQEEIAHLEESQIAEQNNQIYSVDYDVWIDEKTGYKKIEKYNAYQHLEECSSCGFVTRRLTREEIIKKPTDSDPGLMIKHYKCGYCGRRSAREVVLAPLSENVAS